MTTHKRATPYIITRSYAPDATRQVLALLRLLVAGDDHSHMDATQTEPLAQVSRLDPEESLEEREGKEAS